MCAGGAPEEGARPVNQNVVSTEHTVRNDGATLRGLQRETHYPGSPLGVAGLVVRAEEALDLELVHLLRVVDEHRKRLVGDQVEALELGEVARLVRVQLDLAHLLPRVAAEVDRLVGRERGVVL